MNCVYWHAISMARTQTEVVASLVNISVLSASQPHIALRTGVRVLSVDYVQCILHL